MDGVGVLGGSAHPHGGLDQSPGSRHLLTVRGNGAAHRGDFRDFMPAPVELEAFPIAELGWVDADGQPADDETRAALAEALGARLAAEAQGGKCCE